MQKRILKWAVTGCAITLVPLRAKTPAKTLVETIAAEVVVEHVKPHAKKIAKAAARAPVTILAIRDVNRLVMVQIQA